MSRPRTRLLIAAALAVSVLGPAATADQVPTCHGKVATIVGDVDGDGVIMGTRSSDVIVGTGKADRIEAGGGSDTICSLGGADVVLTGWGSDYVKAGKGDDVVSAGTGNDRIFGGPGDDEIDGGAGDDTVDGDSGDDDIKGSDGNDTLRGGAGDDALWGGLGNDLLEGGAGDDRVAGQDGGDIARGDTGNDRVYGNAGDDVTEGGDHTDRIWAGPGINLIDGGPGYDVCGGAGARQECEARHHSWTVEEWRDLVAKYFDRLGETENALLIIDCESKGDPFSVNPGSDASGLFQFLRGTWDWMAGEKPKTLRFDEGRFDPELNVLNASKLVDYSMRENPNAPWAHWYCRYVLDAPSE
ncbi:MAG: hypothetical protein KJ698_13230 [Actinobacteria bacterium]|nr:hypothetical protein [Actinomycetota bacterium]